MTNSLAFARHGDKQNVAQLTQAAGVEEELREMKAQASGTLTEPGHVH